jgi:hypothetical protein
MKICHIISGDQWAGAEVMVYNLLKGLREYKGVELYCILFNDGIVAKQIKEIGISVQIVDEKKYNIFRIINKTRDILEKNLPDIIHSHRQKENIVAYYSSCSMSKVKRFCTQHGMPEPLNNIKKELKARSCLQNFIIIFYRIILSVLLLYHKICVLVI